jgi:hypothetical protein
MSRCASSLTRELTAAPWGRHHLAGVQHAVDAVAHVQAVVEGLQVDVRGPQLDHAADDGVDQADHRRLAGQVAQVLDEVAGVARLARAGLQRLRFGLVLLAPQRLVDVRGQRHAGAHLQAGAQVQGLDDEGVLWRAHGHHQVVPVHPQGQHVVGLEEFGLQAVDFGQDVGKPVTRHERQPQVLGQGLRGVQLGHQAQADQHGVQRAAHFALRRQRALQVAGGQLARRHQPLTVVGPLESRGRDKRRHARGDRVHV